MSFLLIDTKLICMCTGPPAWLFHIYFAFLKSFLTCILILHLSLRKQTKYLFSRSSRNEIILKEFITFPKRDKAFIMFLNSFWVTFFISWLHQGVNVSFSEKFPNVPMNDSELSSLILEVTNVLNYSVADLRISVAY